MCLSYELGVFKLRARWFYVVSAPTRLMVVARFESLEFLRTE
jgi:hypothetical protein